MDAVTSGDLDWNKLRSVGGLDAHVLPVVEQDADDRTVIMVAYLTPDALAESARTGRAVFYSTSRQELHRKGETSGDVLEVVGVRANCDQNSVLMTVRKLGTGACHERDSSGQHYASCFFRPLVVDDSAPSEVR